MKQTTIVERRTLMIGSRSGLWSWLWSGIRSGIQSGVEVGLRRIGILLVSVLSGSVIGLFGIIGTVHASTIRHVTDYGTSSATVAIGDIYGISPHAYAVFENPAALAKAEGIDASAMFMTLADAISTYTNAAVSIPFIKGRLGIGYAQMASGGLDDTKEDRFKEFYSESSFDVTETLIKLSWQNMYNRHIAYGLALSVYEQDLYITTGSGINADIGIQANFDPVLVSFVVMNAVPQSKVAYSGDYQSLEFPTYYVLSTKLNYTRNITGYSQIRVSGHHGQFLKSFGAAYKIPYTGLSLLIGWREMAEAGSVFNRFTTGVLLDLHLVRLSISYEKTGVATNSDAYSFSVDINL